MHSKTAQTIVHDEEEITSFSRRKFPLIYLGCPIGCEKKEKIILQN